ncbi:hypothetical protein HC723_08020 [Vibrio sp. S11_S32]|uniref:hypothetical protein n=1 Tax=Vibrio sp. S11_S32 TaxID=2720225 RepID=UPI0016810A73|nr:hypothetical protein [Vibrio sp. S11_S32]MBD1576382.1 hypothetical protein [Vibrio sp. S11_S32]
MSYFDSHQLEREEWRCSLSLLRFFESGKVGGFFYRESEYVAIWYYHRLATKQSNTLVEIKFVQLTNPTYIAKNGEERQSFLIVKVPINYLHKIPFGSIWVNGESKQRFKLQRYEVKINEKKQNLLIRSISDDAGNHPFKYRDYVHYNDIPKFEVDKNRLLIVTENDISFIIHPLQFFMAHYGYSCEIKRIISVYNWSKVEQKLHLNDEPETDCECPVILPRNLSHKDAIFLHHLKYDRYTRKIIKDVNNKIILAKEHDSSYIIPYWHNQSIQLSFYGIPLGDSVLCAQITGISQPQGNAVNLILAPKSISKKEGISNDNEQFRMVKLERERETEQLDIAINPVNNLVSTNVIEKLVLIGQERQINKAQDSKTYQGSLNVKYLPYEKPSNFGVGDKYGALGGTGIANCFYDVPNTELDEGKSRLDLVWEHAIRLRKEQNAKVCWYTPKCGFNENDNFKLISLKEVCEQLNKNYPLTALVLRIDINVSAP